jgi:hypothetical protein
MATVYFSSTGQRTHRHPIGAVTRIPSNSDSAGMVKEHTRVVLLAGAGLGAAALAVSITVGWPDWAAIADALRPYAPVVRPPPVD